MNINEKIDLILNNIKNKRYTSFEFTQSLPQAPSACCKSARNHAQAPDFWRNKKRKLKEIENDVDNNLEINYKDNKFYIVDKKLRKNIICDDCPICYEKIKIINKITLQCKHIFCTLCHYNWEKTCFLGKKDLSCPLCRKVSNIIE
jgi:hypothetical protein